VAFEACQRGSIDEQRQRQLAVLLAHQQLLGWRACHARVAALLVVDDEGVDVKVGPHAVQRPSPI
jgi:hypothetical protein